MIEVKHLLLKVARGNTSLNSVSEFTITNNGIEGGVPCLPSRQVLILPNSTLTDFSLNAGDLRENIIIDGFDIHSLESGTVITIGEIEIRLTYHCEPCVRVKEIVDLKQILHKRGFLGCFLNNGIIRVGDKVVIGTKKFESIPYDIKERIKWYLDKQNKPVTIKKLAFEVGLSQSYYRAIPNLMKNMELKYKKLVHSANEIQLSELALNF